MPEIAVRVAYTSQLLDDLTRTAAKQRRRRRRAISSGLVVFEGLDGILGNLRERQQVAA